MDPRILLIYPPASHKEKGAGNVVGRDKDTLFVYIESGVTTANDVVAAFSSAVNVPFTARLDTSDNSTSVAAGTGFVDLAATGVTAGGTLDGAAVGLITGVDVNPLETKGAFTSLVRLNQALNDNDLLGIQRAAGMLDDDITRLNFTRAEMGARQLGMGVLEYRLEDEEIELRRALSMEIDDDLVATVSRMAARQASFEASLRTIAMTFQMTLLDFL